MVSNCAKCKQPGADSPYKGNVYHMSCRIEMKTDAGEWASTSAPAKGANARVKKALKDWPTKSKTKKGKKA